MNYVAKLIRPDGRMDAVHPKNGSTFSLEELRELVGGYIEIIYPKSSGDALMVINEEGKLKGLPHNEFATKIWLYGGDLSEFGGGKLTVQDVQRAIVLPPPLKDYIVGDALLCHKSQLN